MMVGRRIEQLFPKVEAKLGEVVLELENVVRSADDARASA